MYIQQPKMNRETYYWSGRPLNSKPIFVELNKDITVDINMEKSKFINGRTHKCFTPQEAHIIPKVCFLQECISVQRITYCFPKFSVYYKVFSGPVPISLPDYRKQSKHGFFRFTSLQIQFRFLQEQ
jgi:hypothetical protein